MAVLTIDTEEISKLAKEGSEFTMDAEAELSLARLLHIREQIDGIIEKVKAKLEKTATEMDSNFTGLKGDKLKIEYRAFGAEYKMPDPTIVSDEFKISKTTYSIDTKRVKAYEKDAGMLPVGIERVERKKQISIKAIA